MVNSFYSSIINYKIVYKPSSMENYVQSEIDWENNEMFFIDWQYRQNRPMCGRHRSTLLSFYSLYWPGIFQYTKKYFVYKKVVY